MRIEDILTIEAPAGVVWDLTIDVANWPSILPTVTRLERLDDGPMRVGSRARIKQPGQSEAVWTVTRLDEGRGFSWQTKRLGLTMTGSHELEPVGQHCRNTLTIEVKGRGAGLFGVLFGGLIRRTIATENASFRARARKLAQPG